MTLSVVPSSNRSRVRGSYKKSEISRRQVLEAAVRALSRQGYAKTSVSDIAQAAGMSKGAVHYHFDSKDDLIAEVLEHCVTITRERVRAVWDAPGEPAQKIHGALREMRAMRRAMTPELRVIADLRAQALYDARLRAMIGEMHEVSRRELVQHLTRSFEEIGVKPKVPVHIIPRLLLGAVDGLAMHDFFDPPDPAEDADLELALDAIGLSLFEV